MSFSRMKPLPKILIIGGLVAAVIFGIMKFGPKPAPQGVAEQPLVNAAPEPMVPPTQNPQPQVSPQPTPTPQPPVVQAPQPTPPAADNAGLANVLGSTKK